MLHLALTVKPVLPSAMARSVGAETASFHGSIPGPHLPLSTLRPQPRGRTRMTRGRRWSLTLRRKALSSSPSCRFDRRTSQHRLHMPRGSLHLELRFRQRGRVASRRTVLVGGLALREPCRTHRTARSRATSPRIGRREVFASQSGCTQPKYTSMAATGSARTVVHADGQSVITVLSAL